MKKVIELFEVINPQISDLPEKKQNDIVNKALSTFFVHLHNDDTEKYVVARITHYDDTVLEKIANDDILFNDIQEIIESID